MSLSRPTLTVLIRGFVASVAQLAELLICNQPVGGSSPLAGLPDGVTVAQGILVPFV